MKYYQFIDIINQIYFNDLLISDQIGGIRKVMTLKDKINILINKIFKTTIDSQIKKNITNQILKSYKLPNKLIKFFYAIYESLKNFKFLFKKNNDFIGMKLSDIIKFNFKDSNINELNIIDIGGNSGELLNIIGNNLSIPKSNLTVVESMDFKLKGSSSLNYISWDNKLIDLPDNSIDVFIIMLTLHYMNDSTVDNLFNNIKRLSKKNSIIIIKEYHVINNIDRFIVNWDHYLHYIINAPKNLLINDFKNYIDNLIIYFKSIDYYDYKLKSNGYKLISRLNRSLNKFTGFIKDINNVEKIYWSIYRQL